MNFLNDAQTERMLGKLKRLEKTLEPYIFTGIGEAEVRRFETGKQYHQIPDDRDVTYIETQKGDKWGKEGSYCWFRGTVRIPEEYRGHSIYINPRAGGYEGMLWVNGVPAGIFANKLIEHSHGNHYCNLLVGADYDKDEVELAVEFYAGHYIIGTQPFETAPYGNFENTFEEFRLCVKNQDIADFIFDLRTLNQMVSKLDPLSFRRADIINCLMEVHKLVYYSVEDVDESIWRQGLAKAREVMKPCLEAKNSGSAAYAGLIGHSHMDTAWLWPITETIKKCARTYSNQVSLMNQYPEYTFIQSSAYHLEMMRLHYPELFSHISEKIAEGRYEPNGGVWVECDCNITSGEAMIRQFLWGQRYTRKHFNFTSNCFWLPDTFGYSAAIPQIMKGCGVDYFLTTKIAWNDTNRFPYETFYWEGIDGTSVFTHFNTIHCWPEPITMLERIEGRGSDNYIRNKTVGRGRLISYGYGDGGGGPQFEMIEMARRIRDLDGCPRAEHTRVGDFMSKLEKEAVEPPHYRGELYLELHRGTLTNQHTIKRNNRKAEIGLHDLELLNVVKAVKEGKTAGDESIRPLLETVLVNQFHDILPGTSLESVHVQSNMEMTKVIEQTGDLINAVTETQPAKDSITVINTLGFEREEMIYLKDAAGRKPADNQHSYQRIKNIHGEDLLCIAGIKLPPMGSTVVSLTDGAGEEASNAPFTYMSDEKSGKDVLITPFARVTFNSVGTIDSFVDTRVDRELRGSGLPLNTFLMAEDVPTAWDNWDLDADCQMRFQPAGRLLERKNVGQGDVQCRIRSKYSISDKSTIEQDMVFYSTTPRVDFETVIYWKDKHRFLKVDFDTNVMSTMARHEIQFGHCQRPTTRNTDIEKAMFEVLNHKFTDLSETRYGVALLNDCKYGVSVEGSDIRLSLHKGGCRPDPRGDEGVHECIYSFMPHVGGFSAENVVQPAYSLNYRPVVKAGILEIPSFASVSSGNVIIETVKACEDNQKAFIIRLYEAEGTFANTRLKLGMEVTKVEIVNMLEEHVEALDGQQEVALAFKPFEIKTLKISY